MNPYLPLTDYNPDGEPHVFGDRVYIYTSHDKERGNTFCMLDYVVYSADINDLSHWTTPGIAYSAKQDPLSEGIEVSMYAPDCVKGNDGRYYLYYCLSGFQGGSGYSFPISVAVSDYPDRDFKFYGHVRYSDGTLFNGDIINFDPAVMNDNGIIRLYFGAYYPLRQMMPKFIANSILKKIFKKDNPIMGAFNVTLDDDMLTINSDIYETITERQEETEYKGHSFFEASSIRKIGDTYYFIFSTWNCHELCYATSKDPTTGFKYQGVLVSNGSIGLDGFTTKKPSRAIGNNHGSIEKIKDDYYIFYHRHTHNTSYSRQACVEKITIKENGLIDQVEDTSLGFSEALLDQGLYKASICCILTNNKGLFIRNGSSLSKNVPYIYSDDDGQYVKNISNKTVIGYRYFSFNGDSKLYLLLRGNAKGKLLIYANDSLLNSIDIYINSNEYIKLSTNISYDKKATLLFKYQGKGSFDFKEFELMK